MFPYSVPQDWQGPTTSQGTHMTDTDTWHRAAVDLGYTHLTSRWTLLPMLGLLVAIGFNCVTTSLHKLVGTPALAILVGGVNLSSHHMGALLLFWLLSHVLLPVQVLGLHDLAAKAGLLEGLQPVAMARLRHKRWTARLLAMGLAVGGTVAIGEILFGGFSRHVPLHSIPDLVAFLTFNWLLLHLLMVGLALLTAHIVATHLRDVAAARPT